MDAKSTSTSPGPKVKFPEVSTNTSTSLDGALPLEEQRSSEPSPPRKYPKPLPRPGCGHEHSWIKPWQSNMIMTIDNASVLELWASIVTQRVHPDLPWETCLSAGNVVLRIVRDGIIYDIDHHKKEAVQDNRLDGLSRLDIMRFKLALKNNLVVLGEEVVTGDETILKQKFATSEDYNTMKEWLEHMAKHFAKDYLDERALDMFNYFKPAVNQGLDLWSTRTVFNCMVLYNCVDDYGTPDIRWFRQRAEEEEEEFIKEERLRALEKAAAKKTYRRMPLKPTPKRVTRAEAARAREMLPAKAFTSEGRERSRMTRSKPSQCET